jgi:hypothetical protein
MEKLDYFLSLKKKYSNILIYLQEMYNIYQSILEIHKKNNKLQEYYEIHTKFLNIDNEISETKSFLRSLEKDICENCIHDFVEDLIDIHPEKALNIKYCSICEYTCEL